MQEESQPRLPLRVLLSQQNIQASKLPSSSKKSPKDRRLPNSMSGIEAAGLLLALFPIVVSGLQHFTEGLETVKKWRRYHRELAKY